MKCIAIFILLAFTNVLLNLEALAGPTSVGGDTFTLVATNAAGTQLFGITADAQGNVYAGNNSNGQGIPLQRFSPATFAGTPLPLENFGPVCNDGDGLAFNAGSFFVADNILGIRKISVTDGATSSFNSSVGFNSQGSPLVVRAADGHVFSSVGDQVPQLREFDANGQFVASHTLAAGVETMTFDDATGTIYYAPFPAGQVRAYNPNTATDTLVATINGSIDGGLAVDHISNRIFIGTAYGAEQGKIYVMDLTTHAVSLYASGFNDCLGILREQVSGDLYFLEEHKLYRITSAKVTFSESLTIREAVELSWFAVIGKVYQLQSTTDASANTWTDFGLPINGDGATHSFFDSTLLTPKKFYRLITLP